MPSPDTDRGPATPALARVIALALLGGVVLFVAVAVGLLEGGMLEGAAFPSNEPLADYLPYSGLVLLVLCLPVGFGLRSRVFKQVVEPEDEEVAYAPYLAGNLLFFAMLEGPALLGVVSTLITGSYFPALLAPVLAIAVGLTNLPGEQDFRSRRELRGL